MMYACPYCNWSLTEPEPSDYPDTEQGQDSLAADYAYFELEKEQHNYNGHLIRSVSARHEEYIPL